MENQISNKTSPIKRVKDWAMFVLAALIIIGFFGVLIMLVFHEIPDKNKDALNLILGALIASFSALVSYFFGSSKGSSDKNELLKNAQR